MSSNDNAPSSMPPAFDAPQHRAMSRWIVELPHQGVFATDTELRIVVWSRWMEVHTGHLGSEVRGHALLDLYPDLVARGLEEHYRGALDGRITVLSHALHRFLLRVPPTDPDLSGDYMPQTGRITPLWDDDEVIGTVTIIEDVSGRLAAENELRRQIDAQREARATAETALRVKDEFLSTLSHEMRSPLNAILGWARILLSRKALDPDLLVRAVEVIERNAAAQAKMIDDMLDIARITTGKLRLEMESVDLIEVVLAAIDVVGPSAHARQIAIQTSFDPTVPRIFGDPDRCQQIVWNLLSNAVKFTDPGGRVAVRLERAGMMVRLVVRDNGQGISPAFLPFVFERFRQHDASSARRYGGLGLGLALVRELVQLHGGRVFAESEGEGRGASFTVEIPGQPAEPGGVSAREADHRTRPAAVSLAGVRVLVVEDETDARDVIVSALEQSGAEVTGVASSEEALGRIRQLGPDRRPHVLVSDIGMPDEDGYGLIRRIRALEQSGDAAIPAIAVTGYATPDDVQRVLGAGYQLHVAKPIDPLTLAWKVAELAVRAGAGGGGFE